ncbi:hypothetical protein C8R44DRAFT_738813 [Mycena epipterygia]|nr:hypothetical protein C8R44DRAFT_738813 [Mycena epipterygia]
MAPISHHLEPILAFSLNDPMNPRACCIYSLYSALVQIYGSGHGLPYQVSFLQAAMKFMSTPRSAADHAQLRRRLCECHCDWNNPQTIQLHSPVPPALTAGDIYELTLFILCKVLASMLESFNPTLHDAKKRWPTRLEDLLPFGGGPRQLCDTLLKWGADPSTGYGCFALIGGVAMLWPQFQTHVLRTPAVFSLATDHLQHALDKFPTHDLEVLFNPRFDGPVSACAASLFQKLAQNKPGVADIMLRGILPRMHAIAVRMQAHLIPGESEGDMQKSCAWFEVVCRRNGHTFVPRGVPPPAPDNRKAYLHCAWGLMVGMRNVKCTAPSCGSRTAPEDSRMCGGCGVARYCSGEHQKRAWNAQPHPHKVVCGHIQELRRAIGMEDKAVWRRLVHDTQAGRSSQAFIALCIFHNVSPDMGRAIMLALGQIRPSD